jgi:hypothetical protein
MIGISVVFIPRSAALADSFGGWGASGPLAFYWRRFVGKIKAIEFQ